MPSFAMTVPYMRTSPLHIPRRDLVLGRADSLFLRVTVVSERQRLRAGHRSERRHRRPGAANAGLAGSARPHLVGLWRLLALAAVPADGAVGGHGRRSPMRSGRSTSASPRRPWRAGRGAAPTRCSSTTTAAAAPICWRKGGCTSGTRCRARSTPVIMLTDPDAAGADRR